MPSTKKGLACFQSSVSARLRVWVAVATGFAPSGSGRSRHRRNDGNGSRMNDPGGTVLTRRDLSIGGSLRGHVRLERLRHSSEATAIRNTIQLTARHCSKIPTRQTSRSSRDNHTEELTTAGVDFIAAVGRGHRLNEAPPGCCGDLRSLTGLVDAIQARNDLRLKIAVLFDLTLPASLADKKELDGPPGGFGGLLQSAVQHRRLLTAATYGGYQYFWDYNLKSYFDAVPDAYHTVQDRQSPCHL